MGAGSTRRRAPVGLPLPLQLLLLLLPERAVGTTSWIGYLSDGQPCRSTDGVFSLSLSSANVTQVDHRGPRKLSEACTKVSAARLTLASL